MADNVKYPSLNGIRAISILLVIFHHINLYFPVLNGVATYFPIIVDGQFGVNVFFVISGFLITGILLREENKTGTISLKAFYTRRTLRILPAYYVLLLVYLALTHFNYIFVSNASWFTTITFTKYVNWNLDWYTSHAWSLSIEENFYLVWPFIFLIGKKTRKIFVLFIILLIPLLRMYFYFYPRSWASQLSIFCRLDAIAIGCAVALYQERILLVYRRHSKKFFYLSVSLLLLLLFEQELNTTYKIHLSLFNTAFAGSFGTLTNLLIASIMIHSVFGPEGAWFKLLNSRILNLIGLWSYSLYLWQQLFLYKTSLWINQYPLNILLTFGMAILSYYLVEKPFLALRKNSSQRAEIKKSTGRNIQVNHTGNGLLYEMPL